MSEHLRLGELITTEQQRDAVHIAVCPVVAGQRLTPGTHVHVTDGRAKRSGKEDIPIGIVDPYLKANVSAGERFWLFLYPGSITSLRHEWTHPALPLPAQQTPVLDEKAASERWLRDLCERHREGYDAPYEEYYGPDRSLDYHGLVSVMSQDHGPDGYDGYTQQGSESLRDEMFDDKTRAEFWHHLEVVTGKKFDEKHRETHYFSCSC